VVNRPRFLVVILDPEVLLNPDAQDPIERYSKDEFVSLIEKELKEVAAVLPAVASEYGRFTKGTAYTILSKLYMQEKRWADAEAVCRQIVALGIYKLQSSYQSIFAVDNEQNEEIIWALVCLAQGGFGNNWMAEVMIPLLPLDNPRIVRWHTFKTPWIFYDSKYQAGDSRLNSLIGEFWYTPEGEATPVLATRSNCEYLEKGALPVKYPEDPAQTTYSSGNDMVIFRYADILLTLAEVINEQNGPTSEAIDYVEQIRSRADLPNTIPVAATASKEAFRDYILDERGRELFCESHRRRDLIRHGKFISTAHAMGYTWAEPHMVLFPIPQNVIDESEGKIKQNPGY